MVCATPFNIIAYVWRYKIVAHFEIQTYQPVNPLINCYFAQI